MLVAGTKVTTRQEKSFRVQKMKLSSRFHKAWFSVGLYTPEGKVVLIWHCQLSIQMSWDSSSYSEEQSCLESCR